MSFGLCNAPATFQRCMMSMFSDLEEEVMEIFMDDFTVYGSSFEHCLQNLATVLHRCQDKNLALNWEKCHFMVTEGIVLVTPPIPVRPDWRIRTGFGVRYHILGLPFFFFFKKLNLYLWYTNNFCNNQQSFTIKNELPPEWYPLKFIHIY